MHAIANPNTNTTVCVTGSPLNHDFLFNGILTNPVLTKHVFYQILIDQRASGGISLAGTFMPTSL